MFNRKSLLIMLLLILGICLISSVSAADLNDTNANDETLAVESGEILAEYTSDDVKMDAVNSEEITVENENTLQSTASEEVSAVEERIVLAADDVKATTKQTGNQYKNTKITVTFTNSDGSAYADQSVKLIFKSKFWDDSKTVELQTDIDGVINYNVNLKPDPDWMVTYYISDNGNWKEIGTKNVIIKYVPAKVIVSKSFKTYYKSGKKIAVRVVDKNNKPLKNVKVTLDVFFKFKQISLKTNSKGYVYFKTKWLNIDNHEAEVGLGYERIYGAKDKTLNIKITKIPVKIKVQSKHVKDHGYKIGGGILCLAKSKVTKKSLPLKFKMKIYTGKKHKTITLKSTKKSKYWAGIVTNAFKAGTHKVVISASSSKYAGKVTTKLKIPKFSTYLKKYYIIVSNGKIKTKTKL